MVRILNLLSVTYIHYVEEDSNGSSTFKPCVRLDKIPVSVCQFFPLRVYVEMVTFYFFLLS